MLFKAAFLFVMQDVLEATEGLPYSCGSWALLNLLIGGVKWLRRALEALSGPHNSRNKSSEVEDIIRDYQVTSDYINVLLMFDTSFLIHRLFNTKCYVLIPAFCVCNFLTCRLSTFLLQQ